jgi:hypothetical protein
VTILFVSYSILIALTAVGAVWIIHQAYVGQVDGLRAERKDLLDRLLQKNGQPPSGVDLTEKYEERQEREKAQWSKRNAKPKSLGPLERVTAKWTADDRRQKTDKNVDVTQPRKFIT